MALLIVLITLLAAYNVFSLILKKKEEKKIENNKSSEKLESFFNEVNDVFRELIKYQNEMLEEKERAQKNLKEIAERILKYYEQTFSTEIVKKVLNEKKDIVEILKPDNSEYLDMTEKERVQKQKLKDELEMLKVFIFALKNQSRFSNVLKVTFEELEIEMWVMEKLEYLDKETKEKLIEKLLTEINKEIKIV